MNIEKFINLRPFLYHLTDRDNINEILNSKLLLSTKKIVEKSNIKDKKVFLRSRRAEHVEIKYNNHIVKIRDQRPISLLALSKCLTNGWTYEDFIEHINKRVFFWCTEKRLNTHFQRYKGEKPIIIRCDTESIIKRNYGNVELCRLNSGATRANSHLGGIAPPRGKDTFQKIDQCELRPGEVVEFTVVEICHLNGDIHISDNPKGPWKKV